MILVPVRRPDGRLYRPRKIAAYPVSDSDELFSGVCVLGTHDLAVAQPLADKLAYRELGGGWSATEPETGWFREGYDRGSPVWLRDEVTGRAGIMFREVTETGAGE
jgi:hypothetical protein